MCAGVEQQRKARLRWRLTDSGRTRASDERAVADDLERTAVDGDTRVGRLDRDRRAGEHTIDLAEISVGFDEQAVRQLLDARALALVDGAQQGGARTGVAAEGAFAGADVVGGDGVGPQPRRL